MTRVLVTGATGTIGRRVVTSLLDRGDDVIALSRDPAHGATELEGRGVEVHRWADPTSGPPPTEALQGTDAVIHLLGEPVAQRWSAEAKTKIRESRVLSTRRLVAALRELPDDRRPRVLVSQSAVGFYGASDDRELDEEAPPGADFLAGVVTEWEQEAQAAEPFMRVVRTRTGVVLTATGGALARMLPFFRIGIGGPVAGGRQYVPWIHLDDTVAAILFCLGRDLAMGPVNVTAPTPVTNADFSRALGHALHRPAVLPVPGPAVALLYGEMAHIVTTGQRVVPQRLRELGFQFRHSELEPALADVLGRTIA